MRQLVPYAGWVPPKSPPRVKPVFKPKAAPKPVAPFHPLGERALNMFQSGHGTDHIALVLGVSEPDALRLVTNQRCRRKRLPSPYEAQP